MKKLLFVLCLILLGVAAQAQLYIWKVTPKPLPTEIEADTVIGIRAKLIGGEIAKTGYNYTFYIEFVRASGTQGRAFNLTLNSLVEIHKRTKSDAQALVDAQAQWNVLIPALIAGTPTQRYAAAQALAGAYGYTLKPLSEQP